MILKILGHRFHYEIENLCRVFYPFEKIRTVFIDEPHDDPRNVTTVLAKQAGRIQMLVRAQIDGDLKKNVFWMPMREKTNRNAGWLWRYTGCSRNVPAICRVGEF